MQNFGTLQIVVIIFALVFVFWAFSRHMRTRRRIEDEDRREQRRQDRELARLIKGDEKAEEDTD